MLQGFTLDVPDGEVVTVIGPSGSGKSTALKTIIGLLEPDQGEVHVGTGSILNVNGAYDDSGGGVTSAMGSPFRVTSIDFPVFFTSPSNRRQVALNFEIGMVSSILDLF